MNSPQPEHNSKGGLMNLKFDGEMVQAEWHDVACAALSTLMVLLTILILI